MMFGIAIRGESHGAWTVGDAAAARWVPIRRFPPLLRTITMATLTTRPQGSATIRARRPLHAGRHARAECVIAGARFFGRCRATASAERSAVPIGRRAPDVLD